MPPTMKKSPHPHFSGVRLGSCQNPDCPVREVSYAIKRDAEPDAPAVCPRCRGSLTLFHWREESAREFWPVLEAEGNVLWRQQG
jgi:hypothetical protein